MARIDSFLTIVAEQQGSDLHFHAGNVPVVRHDGELIPLPFRTLSDVEAERLILEILSVEQKERLESERHVDLLYLVPGLGRFRANVFVQSRGLSAVFRVIPKHIPSLRELGLPGALKKLGELGNGLVLVTGPTGSGKTTTLAALVNEINQGAQRHIITVEDPIEFVHEPLQSVITHREVGQHTASFAAGLRAALREAPDVVVLGEMRDRETTQLALSAAETGVLVLATLHTNSAAKALDRIIDVIPEDARDQARASLSVVLKGVVAQHLCRRAVGEGRIAAAEVLLQNHAVSHMIRENKIHQLEAYLQSAGGDGSGMQSLDACLLQYVNQGVLEAEEALHYANNPEQFGRSIASLPEDD